MSASSQESLPRLGGSQGDLARSRGDGGADAGHSSTVEPPAVLNQRGANAASTKTAATIKGSYTPGRVLSVSRSTVIAASRAIASTPTPPPAALRSTFVSAGDLGALRDPTAASSVAGEGAADEARPPEQGLDGTQNAASSGGALARLAAESADVSRGGLGLTSSKGPCTDLGEPSLGAASGTNNNPPSYAHSGVYPPVSSSGCTLPGVDGCGSAGDEVPSGSGRLPVGLVPTSVLLSPGPGTAGGAAQAGASVPAPPVGQTACTRVSEVSAAPDGASSLQGPTLGMGPDPEVLPMPGLGIVPAMERPEILDVIEDRTGSSDAGPGYSVAVWYDRCGTCGPWA